MQLADDVESIEKIGKEMFGLKLCLPIRGRLLKNQFSVDYTTSGSENIHGRRLTLTFYADGKITSDYPSLDKINMFKLVNLIQSHGYSA